MVAVMHHPGPGSLDGPPSSGFGLSLYARFISIPEINLGIVCKGVELPEKFLPQVLVLPVGPRLRNLQHISFLMEKSQNRGVGALKGILGSDVPMKCSRGPEGPLGAARLLKLFENLFFLPTGEKGLASCPSLRHQTVGAIGVEGPDDLLYGALRQIGYLHYLLTRRAHEEHNDDKTSSVRLLIARSSQDLEIGKGCVLRVRGDQCPCHMVFIYTEEGKNLELSYLNR